jgi:hypothetical protein
LTRHTLAQNKHYLAVAIALEGLGAALFILGQDLGAQMLVRAAAPLATVGMRHALNCACEVASHAVACR